MGLRLQESALVEGAEGKEEGVVSSGADTSELSVGKIRRLYMEWAIYVHKELLRQDGLRRIDELA